ncbi:MAG: ATP-binding protein [Acidobacteriota bacterium]
MSTAGRLYERLLQRHFEDHRQMAFLMGPRQVGKTTTSRILGKSKARFLYFNWDNLDEQRVLLQGPGALAAQLGLDRLGEEKPLLVLDEIHKYPRWRELLKGFFDTYGGQVNIAVTGSARLNVFHASGDSMMGRYFNYRMHPLSVAELASPRDDVEPGERGPSAIPDDDWGALLRFGGFPEPYLRRDERFARRWRRLRHDLLFREDIRDLTRIQELSRVQLLGQLVAQRAGQLVSYTTFAKEVGVSIETIKRWLKALEALYYCFPLRPWYRNVSRSLRKEPKYFLWDWSLVDDAGARFENLVACALLKAVHLWTDLGYGDFALHFLRDKDKREVDFVVVRDGTPWFLVEAKVSGRVNLSEPLAYFSDKLGVRGAFQVAERLDYVDRSCWPLERPTIVPARTFLSQLV